ncbi:MAG: hypothetical protein IJB81_01900 [Clostridia bacterium]|nr:hypothetical protein [Clostridia bacterium]
MKKILAILLLLTLAAGCLTAHAVSMVNFRGGAENFVFIPGSQYSDTDMFERFKNVMPGDVITQNITLRNSSGTRIRLYLRADPIQEEHRALLEQMNLQVVCRDKEIFDAAASQTGPLTENVLLGAFRGAGTTDLIVTLTVPYDLGNEFMGSMGIVPWTFTAEEIVDYRDGDYDDYVDGEGSTPDTGDGFLVGTWLLGAGMIAAAIGWVLFQMKRQKAAQTK